MIPELLAPCSELVAAPPRGEPLSRPTSTGLLDEDTKEEKKEEDERRESSWDSNRKGLFLTPKKWKDLSSVVCFLN